MTRCTFGGFVLAPPFCSYHSYVKKRWSIIRDLTQQDGWKTQDGRKMKKWYARLCIPGLARRSFFNILPSWVVFQPSGCVSYLFLRSLQRRNWDFVQNRTNVKSTMTMKTLCHPVTKLERWNPTNELLAITTRSYRAKLKRLHGVAVRVDSPFCLQLWQEKGNVYFLGKTNCYIYGFYTFQFILACLRKFEICSHTWIGGSCLKQNLKLCMRQGLQESVI